MTVPSMICLKDKSLITIDKKEVMRYLRVLGNDEAFELFFEECTDKVIKLSSPRAVYINTEVVFLDGYIDFGFMKVKSDSLNQNLKNCKNAFVFAATLGAEIDRECKKMVSISQAKATVFNAIASAYIESFCDYVNEKLVSDLESRPRFSPGYGDLTLECQKEILSFLHATKNLGISLTESLMMIPIKSVTAIIGVK